MTNNINLSTAQQKLLSNAIATRILKDTGEILRVWVSRRGDIEIPLPDFPSPREIRLSVCGMKNITYSHSKKQLVFQLIKVPEND